MDEGIITVGDLVKELKKKFDPEDQIYIFTMGCVRKDAYINPEKNSADMSLHVFNNALQKLVDARKEKE